MLWTLGGVGATALFEYGYFILAGNLLAPEDFGLLSASVAVLTILVILATSGVGISLARFVARCQERVARARLVGAAVALEVVISLLLAGTLAVLVLAKSGESRMGGMTSPLLTVATVFPLVVIATVLPRVLQGLERLHDYNAAIVLQSLTRFLFLPLVLLWAPTPEAAVTSYAAGGMAAIFYCVWKLHDLIPDLEVDWTILRGLLRFSVPVTVTAVVTGLFLRFDIILLKILVVRDSNMIVAQFTPPSMLGRGVFYLASSVSIVLLPVAATPRGIPRRKLRILMISLGAVFTVGVVAAHLVAQPLVAFLFPSELGALSHLLGSYVGAMALLSMASVLTTLLVANGRPRSAALANGAGFVVFLGLSWWLVPEFGPGALVGALVVGASLAFGLQIPAVGLVVPHAEGGQGVDDGFSETAGEDPGD